MSAAFLRIGCRDNFNRQCSSVDVINDVLSVLQNLFTNANTNQIIAVY